MTLFDEICGMLRRCETHLIYHNSNDDDLDMHASRLVAKLGVYRELEAAYHGKNGFGGTVGVATRCSTRSRRAARASGKSGRFSATIAARRSPGSPPTT